MAALIRQGFVIQKNNYGDFDLIVTVLLINSKLSFLARGVRKMTSKNRVALQLGNFIEIEVFEARLNNKLSKLKRATIINAFPVEVADSAQIMMGILKIINKLENPRPYFFKSLLIAFPYFGNDYNHHIKNYFQFLNLVQHGLKPVVDKCYICKTTKNIIDFDLEKGGFSCQAHAKKKMHLEKLKAYRDLGRGFLFYKSISSELNFEIGKEIKNYARAFIF